MGAGVGTVGALLAHKADDKRSASRAITLLEAMVTRGGSMCHDAVQTLCQLVSAPGSAAKVVGADEEGDSDWDWAKLLPNGLFSADPGLLTIDFASLSEEVRHVLKQTATVADVRALSASELWMTGVMDGLIKVWRIALTQVCLSWDAVLPVSRSSFPPCSVGVVIDLFVLVMSSLNSSNHGTVCSRQPSEDCKAQLKTTTMMTAKTRTWCRNLPS